MLPWKVTMVYCTWNKKYVFTKFVCLHAQFELFTCPTPDKGTINTYNITLLFPYHYFSLGISFPSMDKLGTHKSTCPFNIFLKHFLVTHINQKIIFCIPETQQFANILAEILCLQVWASHYSGYCVQVSYFRAQQKLEFLHILNALLVPAVHVKMKLGDNALNN